MVTVAERSHATPKTSPNPAGEEGQLEAEIFFLQHSNLRGNHTLRYIHIFFNLGGTHTFTSANTKPLVQSQKLLAVETRM